MPAVKTVPRSADQKSLATIEDDGKVRWEGVSRTKHYETRTFLNR